MEQSNIFIESICDRYQNNSRQLWIFLTAYSKFIQFLHFRPRKHGPNNYRYRWAVHSTESGSRLNLNSGFKLPRIIVNFLNELTSRLTIVVSCSSCHALVSGPTDYGRSLIRSTLMNPLLIQYFIIRIWSMLLRMLFGW